MDTQTYTKALRAIDEEVSALDEYILSGAPADLVQYHKATAKREGLLTAKDLLKEIFRRANSED